MERNGGEFETGNKGKQIKKRNTKKKEVKEKDVKKCEKKERKK